MESTNAHYYDMLSSVGGVPHDVQYIDMVWCGQEQEKKFSVFELWL
jgi:hypothetical protein